MGKWFSHFKGQLEWWWLLEVSVEKDWNLHGKESLDRLAMSLVGTEGEMTDVISIFPRLSGKRGSRKI